MRMKRFWKMEMFIMFNYSLDTIIDSASELRHKIKLIDFEMDALISEQLKLLKAQAIVEIKLLQQCSHVWERKGIYQFAQYVCSNCGISK